MSIITIPENVYVMNGHKNREAYLKSLAGDFGVPLKVVKLAADLLGESEDFDGLVTTLEDGADMFE